MASASYKPMGPRNQLTFGNGRSNLTPGYRQTGADGNALGDCAVDLSYGVNTAGYITGITDNLTSGYNQSFSSGGKATNMLTLATKARASGGVPRTATRIRRQFSTANFPGRNLTYGYSRTFQLQTINQAGTGVSNITHDAVGNETAVGSSTYTYSARELLQSGDGITYTYDGAGRRVVAQNSLGTRASLYDPNMHLQAESGLTSGTLAYEYVWFGGTPVAQIGTGGSDALDRYGPTRRAIHADD